MIRLDYYVTKWDLIVTLDRSPSLCSRLHMSLYFAGNVNSHKNKSEEPKCFS